MEKVHVMATVLLDSNVTISLLNRKDPMHGPATAATQSWQIQGASFPLSTIVWSEVLAGTLLHRGQEAVDKLTNFRDEFFSTVVPVCLDIAGITGELRAKNHPGLKVPDACVLATGIHLSVDALLTADKRMKTARPDLVELVTV